ncbi:MAG TPA: DEAD/DEAH box helicase [Actinocrinis sp.]|uniref:DEAD/DEAH box helicase n=1 Tax=Actinocrinis sp. TaxID=1920516 RepID=UPI002DDD2A65|nr:DEAD/DEAH box helicase [Actinocrinis sp.]HEV3173412.1 DEAD/DEAH box helicase [Actinocrinis sp.]
MAERTVADKPSAMRRLLRRAADAVSAVRDLGEGEDRLHEAVRAAHAEYRTAEARRQLADMPVTRLTDVTSTRLPIAKLQKAGYETVGSVLETSAAHLAAAPGISGRGARYTMAAAQRIAANAEDDIKVTADLDTGDERAVALLSALHQVHGAERTLTRLREPARKLGEQLAALADAAQPLRSRVRRALAGAERREQARDAAERIEVLLDEAESKGRLDRIATANQKLRAAPAKPARVRKDFEQNAARYFSTLSRIVTTRVDGDAARGFLPEDLAERIARQELDTTHLKVSLRGYQEFGARFALAQRRVILGDEMGCGKTVEAIAALAHLHAAGQRHFLVICPASVLINWMREVSAHSTLRPHRMHGPDRDANTAAWVAHGGVGVTTFEAVQSLDIPRSVRIAMVVVDEAHYVKNPDTQRSRTVRAWTARAERVVFLTGTPMENRVQEFRNLVGYLQPRLVDEVHDADGVAGSRAFRRAVAPAYLRRNQEDVLAELPELVQVDEWEEFGPQELALYREAVAARNFMAMRRAAYATGSAKSSAKLRRLVEIADEARDSGRKVVVFSNFRDVLDAVCEALGGRALGPLTGSVPPARRQEMVDAFAKANGHAVLVSQIQAGGIGLNMQAASVVILCEPQVKPTLETQAIARAHRMGQISRVQVHRLLVADSVDQRMLELLDAKTALFDAFARRSELAETTPQALDLTETALARRVVDAERARLGIDEAGEQPDGVERVG